MSAVQGFLREAPFFVFLILFGIPLLLAGIFLTVGIWSHRNAQALKSVTPVAVSGLTRGYQLVQGRVAEDGALTAPLTGRKCAWYDIKVEEETRTRDSDGEYNYNRRTVREETSDKPIRIVDGNAFCSVSPNGATVFPTAWSEWHGAEKMPADRDPERHPGDTVPGGKGRIEVHGDPNRRFRYLERYIYPGDPVFALGLVERKAGSAGSAAFSLGKPKERKPFMVSTRSPETILAESDVASRGGLIMGAVFAIIAIALAVLRFT